MASKKDLVEAYAFNRRRLVTAFVSGAPGGREMEPSRPATPIIAGVVLGALVIGAGALTGAVKPSVEDGWDDNTIVVARKTGARYLAQSGVMFPVLNTASARLVIPPEEFKVVTAPEDKIAEARQGPTIGIEQAPDALPLVEDLIQSNWTSCAQAPNQREDGTVDPGGMALEIGERRSAIPVGNQGLVVQAPDEKLFVVAGTRAYAADETVIAALGLTRAPLAVPAEWLALFTTGDDLTVLKPAGQRTQLDPGTSQLPAGTRNGDLLAVEGRSEYYVATPQGAFPLTPVQYLLYRQGTGGEQATLPIAPAALTSTAPEALAATASWPREQPTPYAVEGLVACVVLDANERTGPITRLAAPVPNGYLAPRPGGVLKVDPAHGALVRTDTEAATTFLVDSAGIAYRLGEQGEQARLGYGAVRPVFVLQSWVLALRDGVTLDIEVIKGQANAPSAPATTAAAARAPVATAAGRRARTR